MTDVDTFLREAATRDLDLILEKLSDGGKKNVLLFFQQHLLNGLRTLVDFPRLMKRPCIKGYYSIDDRSAASHQPADLVLYFLNPMSDNLECFVRHLQSLRSVAANVVPKFLCIPEKTVMTEQIVEQDFELQDSIPGTEVCSLDIDIQYIDIPLLSMNIPGSFRKVFCDGDLSLLRWIARFLTKSETYFGVPLNIVSVGSMSSRVAKMMLDMQAKIQRNGSLCSEQVVENLIIVDRTADVVTPLLTQVTYDGLIDELYDFNCGQGTFPFPTDDQSPPSHMNLRDRLFDELRDKKFSSVGAHLYERSVKVKQQYEKRKELSLIKEIREYVESLAEIQELQRLISVHTTIAKNIGKVSHNPIFRKRTVVEQWILEQSNEQEVLEYIENLIYQKCSMSLVLRYICLLSTVNGGLKSRDYDAFKELMVLSYGACETVSAFFTLTKSGLLTRYKGKSNELNFLRTYKSSIQRQDNSRLLYTDYEPPLVHWLDSFLAARVAGKAPKPAALLQGMFNDVQEHQHREVNSTTKSQCGTLMFVIGGVTSSEASSVRLLQRKYANESFVVCSTDVVTGNRLVSSVTNSA